MYDRWCAFDVERDAGRRRGLRFACSALVRGIFFLACKFGEDLVDVGIPVAVRGDDDPDGEHDREEHEGDGHESDFDAAAIFAFSAAISRFSARTSSGCEIERTKYMNCVRPSPS